MTGIERYNYAYDPDDMSWAARLLRQTPSTGAVLELGPGPGAMTKVLLSRGQAVTVVEADAQAVALQRELGSEVIHADLEGDSWWQQLQGRRFDAILACDVLEHLRSPERVLDRLLELAAPQAKLVISVPNVAYGGLVAALRLGQFDYSDSGLLDRTHLHFFTRRSLENMLLTRGWMPRHWEGYQLPVEESEFVWSWRALGGEQQRAFVAGWSDFDVYEWMTVATLAEDGAGWAVRQAQTELSAVRQELHALQLVHASEHASLLDHQKAFGEAREAIARFEQELSELRSAKQAQEQQLKEQGAQLAEQLAQLQTQTEELQQLRGESLRQHLRRSLHARLKRWRS